MKNGEDPGLYMKSNKIIKRKKGSKARIIKRLKTMSINRLINVSYIGKMFHDPKI